MEGETAAKTQQTYWRCTDTEEDIAPVSSRPWELRWQGPHRGHCAFSLRSFVRGELILTERPLVSVPGHHPFNAEQVEEIDRRVAALSDNERSAFFEMANAFPDAPSVAAGIFMTNSFDMTDSPFGPGCAMYLAIARLNHSCQPNAQQTHIPETGEEVLYASRDIAVGEEICDCYIELRMCADRRSAVLQELFRFSCACPSCSLPAPAREHEDKMRCRAFTLDEQVLELASYDPTVAFDVAEQLIALLRDQASLSWSVRYLPGAYFNAYMIAEELGRRLQAKDHLHKANELFRVLQGPSSLETLRTVDLLKR